MSIHAEQMSVKSPSEICCYNCLYISEGFVYAKSFTHSVYLQELFPTYGFKCRMPSRLTIDIYNVFIASSSMQHEASIESRVQTHAIADLTVKAKTSMSHARELAFPKP